MNRRTQHTFNASAYAGIADMSGKRIASVPPRLCFDPPMAHFAEGKPCLAQLSYE
jgi:hypothetical protein